MSGRDEVVSREKILRARAGFVLAGGRSSRMGRDKARLPFEGSLLIQTVARHVLTAAGTVTLIGPPERYADLGYPVVADRLPNGRTDACGPLGGVFTALSVSRAPWNLMVACDMPGVTAAFLETLFEVAEALETAEGPGVDCVVPQTSSGLSPLCAVYHRRCVPIVEAAILCNQFKMHDLLTNLRVVEWPVYDPALVENINTPEQWAPR